MLGLPTPLLIAAAIAAAPAPEPAPAQIVVPQPAAAADAPAVAQLIADLGSPDFATRERASALLAERDDARLADLEAAADDPSLHPEQRARLRTAAWHRFARTPRGAIGVSFGGRAIGPIPNAQQNAGYFVIGELYAGFPAHDKQQLKVGDLILKVGGYDVDIPSRNPVRPHIICHDPGDTVAMEIVRDGKIIEVPVELGSFKGLPQRLGARDDLTDLDLRDAWRVRCERRAARAPRPPQPPRPDAPRAALPEPVVVPLPDAVAATDSALALEQVARLRAAEGEWPGVLPGGTGRDAAPELSLADLARGQWGANGVFIQPPRPANDEARLIALVSILTRQREEAQANMDELERAMRDKALRADMRRDVAVKREVYRVQRDALDQQIRRQREQLDLLRQQRGLLRP